jgi:hypothetical protein
MYEVPTNLPLARFVGDFLFSINLAGSSVHFNFDRSGTISVDGLWELRNEAGAVIDAFAVSILGKRIGFM